MVLTNSMWYVQQTNIHTRRVANTFNSYWPLHATESAALLSFNSDMSQSCMLNSITDMFVCVLFL